MTNYELFISLDEPFGAGLFEFEDSAPIIRYANALKRFFEVAPLPKYEGGDLYPSGKNSFLIAPYGVRPQYTHALDVNFPLLMKKSEKACALIYEEVVKVRGFYGYEHYVGGQGWTHSFPNYSRIFKEGLNGYIARINALPDGDFKAGMQITIEAVNIFHARCVEYLESVNAPKKLIDTLKRMPYESPTNIYEALIAQNFVFYLDGCDDIGPFDRNLLPYYKGEEITDLLREFFKNVDANDAWSGTLGPEYNEITRACLRAVRNIRRPNMQLLVTKDMPDWMWEEVIQTIGSGSGQPAIYNYDLYMQSLKKIMPTVPDEDMKRIAFGGCTETMFEGLSNVGSDDAGINVALIFADYMYENLDKCASYEEFYNGLITKIRDTIAKVLDGLILQKQTRAKYRPMVMRTLLIDDCIDSQTEYNNGGARYVWSEINMAGTINVIDSLCVIRRLVFEQKVYNPTEFLSKLKARDGEFLSRAKKCPKYGNDIDEVDQIGVQLMSEVIDAFDQRECFPRGKFYPVSNQFITYAQAGKDVKATPDGRCDGAPLCDSLGAVNGNAMKGSTAMLNSVAKLPLNRIIGTPVTNIRISKGTLPMTLKPLVQGFFAQGGMQLQVTCMSKEDMLKARENPQDYQSLAVRIGGYSEYFVRLENDLQLSVIDRTEY